MIHLDRPFTRFMKISCFLVVLLIMMIVKVRSVDAKDDNGNYVVVIDPGHGGTDPQTQFGATYNNLCEKDINMAVAKSFVQELSQYDGVCTYLTHDQADVPMTLRARAEFANSMHADFFVSIHFNASTTHRLYGMEVWIPSIGDYYTKGYQFADIALQELGTLGMYNRGIKTRVGDNDDEYYGVIRENEHLGIPAVIVEHCYLDYEPDLQFCNSEDKLVDMGKRDATAMAKYLGLTSKALNQDFSNYPKVNIETPQSRVYQDSTGPDQCEVHLTKNDIYHHQISFTITAKDTESEINYYSYSLDGGNQYSKLYEWTGSDSVNVMLDHITTKSPKLVVAVYNKYDVPTYSNLIEITKNTKDALGKDAKDYKDKTNFIISDKILSLMMIVFGVMLSVVLLKIKKKYSSH